MPQDIQDIRRDQAGIPLLDEIRTSLRPQDGGEKRLPTLLLYDEQGLKLFEDITYLDEYYLTNAEIEVLENNAAAIADLMPEDCDVLELGSGYELTLFKQQCALFEAATTAVPEDLDGTNNTAYEDALRWLKRPEKQQRHKWILTLGSSVGNFGREEAATFLQGFANTLGSNDCILVGLDACQDSHKVYSAYNDSHGKTHEFVMNGLVHANRILAKDVFRLEDWKVIGEYDESAGRHQAFYSPTKDLMIDGVYVENGEKIRVEESYKWSSEQSSKLWEKAGLVRRASFGNRTDDYHFYVLAKPTLAFPLRAEEYAAEPVPNLQDFKQLWAAWDAIISMIPEDELLHKPIQLRNGHSAGAYRTQILSDHFRTWNRSVSARILLKLQFLLTKPLRDVDNPELCHDHSEIPDSWPPVKEILDYQARVRARVGESLSERDEANREGVGRALWLGFEHEAMHVETLLYILLQSEKILPPPGPVPNFEALGQKAKQTAVDNEWIKIPATTIPVGMDDPENKSDSACYFGWDNEKPMRKMHVPAFEAKARPLTNEDFARYLYGTNQETLPASWTQQTSASLDNAKTVNRSHHLHGYGESFDRAFLDGKFVRTIYGPVALRHALAWPVFASYDELAGCAKFMHGRIPTAEEVRSIYEHVDVAKKKEAEKVQTVKIDAVNGVNTRPTPSDLFVDLENDSINVGFRHFHPTPVTHLGNKLCGRGELGGVWEWTSSTLEEHQGFVAMEQYPGYRAWRFLGDSSEDRREEIIRQLVPAQLSLWQVDAT
ncbi:MAG: hypothetical protein Q9199_006005 [Rusavskia elegans]